MALKLSLSSRPLNSYAVDDTTAARPWAASLSAGLRLDVINEVFRIVIRRPQNDFLRPRTRSPQPQTEGNPTAFNARHYNAHQHGDCLSNP
jgi:hypothetical protein